MPLPCWSSVNPLYQNLPGYFNDFDVNTGTEDISIREHNANNATGRFLGTSGEWTSLGSSSDTGYAFLANTSYVGVFSITRTGADSLELFSSLSLATGALLHSHTETDESDTANNFGMLGFWVNSNTFGSTTADDPDNGLTFTNVLIERTVIPVPGAAVLLLGALSSLGFMRRRRIS
ncbi:MAG: hypothetical protein KJO54_13180 [Gammaproteobacteria bacterium]|nr:hypothetical protein [Gammaproteobacteria bacterium]